MTHEFASSGYQTDAASGITLPAVMGPGTEWSRAFTLSAAPPVASGSTVGRQLTGGTQSTGTVAESFKALGIETISVPAGTFDVLNVRIESRYAFPANVPGQAPPQPFTVTANSWYAAGVGRVKSISRSPSGELTTELAAFSVR